MNDWGFIGTYSYKVRQGEGKLSFGIQGSIKSYEIDWNKPNPYDPATGIITLANAIEDKIISDANFGDKRKTCGILNFKPIIFAV